MTQNDETPRGLAGASHKNLAAGGGGGLEAIVPHRPSQGASAGTAQRRAARCPSVETRPAASGRRAAGGQPDEALRRARVAERTALYRCFDADDELLYVGISKDPTTRWEQHRDKPWWRHVTMRTIEWNDDRATAERAERKAIQNEGPRYNVHHNQRPADPVVVEALSAPKRGHRTLVDLYPDGISNAQARKIVALLGLGDVR